MGLVKNNINLKEFIYQGNINITLSKKEKQYLKNNKNLQNVVDKKYITIKTYKQNDKIIITIQDNAGGIPDDIILRVFEAYFTTKHKSQGTGLGLYMSYQIIVNKFKGNLEVINEKFTYEDQEYYGAKFIISLNIS
jgi:signal transduction histidine kinase